MSRHRERAYELLQESLRLEDGDERIAVCEGAVAEADLSGDLQTQYLAREHCLRAYVFGGAPEKALVSFTGLLTEYDENPGKFDTWGILWKYKWMLSLVCNFPQIPKARIYEMLDDFEVRMQQAGYGLHAVYNFRYRVEKFWDDQVKAREYFQKMSELPVDALSNCPACLRNEFVGSAIYFGDDARAVDLAAPLLNGEKKCATVPHRTYAKLLLPMVRLGRQAEALNYYRAGYRLIAGNRDFLDRLADHLIFLILTENLERAVELFEKHYAWTEKNRDSFNLFQFFRAAWLLFEVQAERSKERLRLNLPRSFPAHSADGYYDVNSLREWFKEKANDLAQRFDARNETDFFSRTLQETPALKELCAPFPLPEVEAQT